MSYSFRYLLLVCFSSPDLRTSIEQENFRFTGTPVVSSWYSIFSKCSCEGGQGYYSLSLMSTIILGIGHVVLVLYCARFLRLTTSMSGIRARRRSRLFCVPWLMSGGCVNRIPERGIAQAAS